MGYKTKTEASYHFSKITQYTKVARDQKGTHIYRNLWRKELI